MARDAITYFSAFVRGGLPTFLRQLAGDITLADLAARWARKKPEALALQLGAYRLSYRELEALSVAAARNLERSGVRSGDVVALVGRNSIAYVGLLLAGARRGITLALVHPELAGEPLRLALQVARASHVYCEQELEALVREATKLPLTSFDPETDQPFALDGAPLGWATERRFRDFVLIFTSGTTGLPKACRLPHSRVLAAACLFGVPLFDFRSTDKLLCPLPLHHGSPLMLGLGSCLVSGTPLVLERRFSASELLQTARDSGATALLYVGDLGRMLLATPAGEGDRQHGLRVAVGNGMASDVWTQLQARFGIAQIREFYAATESPVGILNLAGRVGSVGNLPYAWLFGLKLVRVDGEGRLERSADGRLVECAVDEAGELLVRARRSGLGVYHGYVDSDATEARLVRDAFRPGDVFFRTHDLLRRDADGFYFFVERAGDSYRFRGENVAVAVVERELLALAGVREAAVAGVELPGYDGRVGLAVLVTEPGFDVRALESLSGRLPRSALPRFVRVVPELLRTNSLKLKRRAWAAEGVDPARTSDPLWLLQGGCYQRLTPEIFEQVLSSKLRL